MKKNLLLSLIIIASLSCKKENTTAENKFTLCFQTCNDTIFLGETTSLTSCSKGFNNYEWDFGYGENNRLRQSNHTYQNTTSI